MPDIIKVSYTAAIEAAKSGKTICRAFMLNRPSLNRMMWSQEREKLVYVDGNDKYIVGCNVGQSDKDATDWVILN